MEDTKLEGRLEGRRAKGIHQTARKFGREARNGKTLYLREVLKSGVQWEDTKREGSLEDKRAKRRHQNGGKRGRENKSDGCKRKTPNSRED